MARGCNHRIARPVTGVLVLLLGLAPARVSAQPGAADAHPPAAPRAARPAAGAPDAAPARVDVEPQARDRDIRQRLLGILHATGWFTDPAVEVNQGVVFLAGTAARPQHRQWAGDLARNTQDVVAVVNNIQVATPALGDFSPAWHELANLARGFVLALPMALWGLAVLALAWVVARLAARMLRRLLRRRVRVPLLREVAARAAGLLVFLLGLYLVLRVAGLTRLAVTVLGGTGLVGLALGIAFRAITENFLASIFLSLQRPFREGDLVEIGGTLGYVERLTSRTTVLTTLTGNQVQIPNAAVFTSTIRNHTSSPNRREDFEIGIGYDADLPRAQDLALRVLADHPAVLREPEPWVLVDHLDPGSVALRVYFWLDGTEHSWLKVRSSAIRLVKRAFQDAGISLPDESREVIFPQGVPVRVLDGRPANGPPPPPRPSPEPAPEAVSTAAEGELRSEAPQIRAQARRAWAPDRGENLLSTPHAGPPEAPGR